MDVFFQLFVCKCTKFSSPQRVSSSWTLRFSMGCVQSAQNSTKGWSTKRRRCIRGCGTVSKSDWYSPPLQRITSMSIRRFSYVFAEGFRTRPMRFSVSKAKRISSSSGPSQQTSTTWLTKSGPSKPHAAVRHSEPSFNTAVSSARELHASAKALTASSALLPSSKRARYWHCSAGIRLL